MRLQFWNYGAQVLVGGEGSTVELALAELGRAFGPDAIPVRPVEGRTGVGVLADVRFSPETDYTDHINVFSGSKCLVGRLLSNFAHTPFELIGDLPWGLCGPFASIEALWYAARVRAVGLSEAAVDRLRPLHGFEAKKVGRRLLKSTDYPKTPELAELHRTVVEAGLLAKLMIPKVLGPFLVEVAAVRPLGENFREAWKSGQAEDLGGPPLVHYYVKGRAVVDAPEDWTHRWWDAQVRKVRAHFGFKTPWRCWARTKRGQQMEVKA